MRTTALRFSVALLTGVTIAAADAVAQPRLAAATTKWITVTDSAAGTNPSANEQALAAALRKAVQEACGSFLTSKAKAANFKVVYTKVFTTTSGYVVEHKVVKTWVKEELTYITVRVHVSTRAFEKRWAAIAHTIDQENNPRCIVIIAEEMVAATGATRSVKEAGIVQGKLEDFFLSKGITLVDRATVEKVTRRDILLASLKGDPTEIAALGARFKADLVVTGSCSANFGRTLRVAGQTLYQYTATLKIRAIRTDSSQLMISKTYGPVVCNTFQRPGGEDKAMGKLGEDAAPKVLKAIVEAWRKQINVRRNIQLHIAGMNYKQWQVFREEARAIRGMQAVRRREITAGVAVIDVEYSFNIDQLADVITELKKTKLAVEEITGNRIKLKLGK